MTQNIVAALIFLGAVVLGIVGLAVLGLGAWAWGYAIAAVHRARSHGLAVDVQEQTERQVNHAVEEAEQRSHRFDTPYRQPTPEEIRETILTERMYGNGETEEYDTLSNEGVPPEAPESQSMYNQAPP